MGSSLLHEGSFLGTAFSINVTTKILNPKPHKDTQDSQYRQNQKILKLKTLDSKPNSSIPEVPNKILKPKNLKILKPG